MANVKKLGELTLEEAARKAAGNWKQFDCFIWWREDDLDDADHWSMVYTSNRDSGLLDQSNAVQIKQALKPFTEGDNPDVVEESHHHWAVGHVDGFSIRVFRDGEITKAFRTLHHLLVSLSSYPVLNEEHYGELESQAAYDNLEHAAWLIRQDYDTPDDWQDQVYEWLSDHRPSSLENTDDQGGRPDDGDLEAAFEALGFDKLVPV